MFGRSSFPTLIVYPFSRSSPNFLFCPRSLLLPSPFSFFSPPSFAVAPRLPRPPRLSVRPPFLCWSAPTSTSSLFLYIALFRQQRKSEEAAPHAATPEDRAPLCRVEIFPWEFGASHHQKLGRKAISDGSMTTDKEMLHVKSILLG